MKQPSTAKLNNRTKVIELGAKVAMALNLGCLVSEIPLTTTTLDYITKEPGLFDYGRADPGCRAL